MNNWGGARVNSGRPPKADEQELIEDLDGIIDRKEAIRLLYEQVHDESGIGASDAKVNDADPVVSGRGHYYVFALYLRPGEFGEFGYVLVKIG
jgi:hypothetical protein